MPKRQNKETYNNYMKEYMIKRYHQRRNKAIEFLGGKCVCCETNENLEFDHINRTEKTINIAKLWGIKEQTFWQEIEKCQLLCTECHRNKSIKERGLKKAKGVHGSITNYTHHGCRCKKCTKAQTQRIQNIRKKRSIKENKHCKKCNKLLDHRNKTGYCRNHKPKGS